MTECASADKTIAAVFFGPTQYQLEQFPVWLRSQKQLQRGCSVNQVTWQEV